MPQIEFQSEHIDLLRRAAKSEAGILRRGRLFGWRANPWNIKRLVEVGYLELVYDWAVDRPALRLTSLGRSRYEEETTHAFSRVRGEC